MKRGYTLVEILVVVTLFVGIAIIVTQSLLLSIQSSRKSLALSKVRENLSSTLSTIETNLRNAIEVNCIAGLDTQIAYVDADRHDNTFQCSSGNISWTTPDGTNRLTSDDVDVTCSFSCAFPIVENKAKTVSISLSGNSTTETGNEAESISMSSTVVLRNP